MLKKCRKNQELTIEGIIQFIKEYNRIFDLNNFKEEFGYIGEHFEERKEAINELNDKDLIFIILLRVE